MGKSRNTRKYLTYPKIPESKKGTRKYPIVFFDTPGFDPLPGILSNTRPDPTRYWKSLPAGHCLSIPTFSLQTFLHIFPQPQATTLPDHSSQTASASSVSREEEARRQLYLPLGRPRPFYPVSFIPDRNMPEVILIWLKWIFVFLCDFIFFVLVAWTLCVIFSTQNLLCNCLLQFMRAIEYPWFEWRILIF